MIESIVGMNVNLQYVLDAVLGVAAVAWICYRQMTWRVVDPARMWRGPLAFVIIGGAVMVKGANAITLNGSEIALLALELVVSVGIGAAMGAIAHFRRLAPEQAAAYEARRASSRAGAASAPVEYESRTSWVGVLLWVALIAIRIALAAFTSHSLGAGNGAGNTAMTGMLFLVLAANRAARVAVLAFRLEQHRNGIAANLA